MNLKFTSIKLECKSGNIDYDFNEHITALYGNIGVGKTSLMNLISFCLGNDLVKTLAIDEQIIGCTLITLYNGQVVSFTRKISSNFISIKSDGTEQQFRIKDGCPEKTITEYFYETENIQPLFWLSKKNTGIHKKTKITFPNFYWFSYLNQDEIDNSFFYLKDTQNYYKDIASRSVLFGCLGGNSQAEAEFQDRLRNYSTELDATNKKISFAHEVKDTSQLFSMNVSNEILRKQRTIISLKSELTSFITAADFNNNIFEILDIQYKIGLYEAEIKYLAVFGKVKTLLDAQAVKKEEIKKKISIVEKEKTAQTSNNLIFNNNIEKLKKLFQETLLQTGFPGMDHGDSIKLYSRDFSPILYSYGGVKKADFSSLSSGGKKTIYKMCYAIAIQRLIKQQNLKTLIPQVLTIDTPMKNISEREDIELYNSLFKLLLDLFRQGGELEDTQLIVVDKELHPFLSGNHTTQYHFTREKPLIPFYKV